ncbi:MAG TPA: hypothetical protein VF598_09885 [Hymenobacter sp.]|jgi:hypothetical protein
MPTNLPPFSETLDQYGISFKTFYKALSEYLDLGHEVMYSADAQADPYGFLRRSDEYSTLRDFFDIMEGQALLEGLRGFDDDEEDEEGEAF